MSTHRTHLTCRALVSITILLLSASAFLVQNGCGDAPHTPIQHVVIIFQENRTPDNLFHDPVLISRGADIASSGVNSKGQTIQLTPIDLGMNGNNPDYYDLSHAHSAFLRMCHLSKSGNVCEMDGADLRRSRVRPLSPNCLPPIPNSNMSIRLRPSLTSKWPSSTHLPIACFRRIRARVFPLISSSCRALGSHRRQQILC